MTLAHLLLPALSAAIRPAARAAASRVSRPSQLRLTADSLTRADVLIVGGGFGGLYTSLRLAALPSSPAVRLLDRADRFAFLPMLYEVTTGAVSCWEVAPRFDDLLEGSEVAFSEGEVVGLDVRAGVATLATTQGERTLPFDHAVLAMGAEPSFGGVPGADTLAMPFYSLNDALALRERLLPYARGATGRVRLAVVGGSYVGVELAANLADWLGDKVDISLIHRAEALLSTSAEFSRMVANTRLEERGVRVLLETSVQAVERDGLVLESSSPAAHDGRLDVDLVVWCAGTQPSRLARELGLPLDPRGRILVDEYLAVQGAPNLHALGDVAFATDASGVVAPSTAQAAMQQADYAAWNVRAALTGSKPLAFRYTALGEMLSLGGNDASVAALAGLVRLQGPLASASRRAVYAARMPTVAQAAKVGASWALDVALGAARAAIPPPRRGRRSDDRQGR